MELEDSVQKLFLPALFRLKQVMPQPKLYLKAKHCKKVVLFFCHLSEKL